MAAPKQKSLQSLVNEIGGDLPEFEQLRLQAVILKEKNQLAAALIRVKKGQSIVSNRLSKLKDKQTTAQYNELIMCKARLLHESAHIHFLLRKYDKAIGYGREALSQVSSISSVNEEILKWKEIVALSYRNCQLWKESSNYFNEILYSLDSILIALAGTANQENNEKNDNDNDNEKENENRNESKKLMQLHQWEARILYEIGMIYNNMKKFKEAEVMARKSMQLNEKYNKKQEMEILSKVLLAAVISSPQCLKYEESLDILKSAKSIVTDIISQINTPNTNDNNSTNGTNATPQQKVKDSQLTKWQSHLTHINNLMSKIIPVYIKHLKETKDKKQGTNSNNNNSNNSNKNNKNSKNKKGKKAKAKQKLEKSKSESIVKKEENKENSFEMVD